MTFSPVIPAGGLAGWAFLKRTMAKQSSAFHAQPAATRDEAYFREKIGSISTAADLVSDRRLLGVALTAFGLESDLNNRAFIQKVLEGGTLNTTGLANKLANKQYRAFSAAFGFGDFSTPRTKLSTFPDEILSAYREKTFAQAVGTQNPDMRLALNAETELAKLAQGSGSELTKWYSILGNAPLRKVFEQAFGLPKAFGALDLDKQVTTLQRRLQSALGADTITQFKDSAKTEKLIRLFLIRSDTTTGFGSVQSPALTLLQQANGVF